MVLAIGEEMIFLPQAINVLFHFSLPDWLLFLTDHYFQHDF